MELNLFGREIIFEIKNNRKDKNGIKKDKKFIYRFVLATLMFLIFGLIVEVYKLRANYTVGSIAENDIIAYKNITYFVDLLDENLRNKIRKNTTPEYDRLPEIEQQEVTALDKFFQDVKTANLQTDEDISNYIKEKKYGLSVEEFKEILSKESVAYIVGLIDKLREIYDYGVTDIKKIDEVIDKKNILLSELDKKFLKNFIKPNLVINEKKTLEKIEENMRSLKDKEVKIYKGDVIVKKGEVIDEDAYEKLEKLNLVKGEDKLRKTVGLVFSFAIISTLFFYILKRYCKDIMESRAFYPTLITISIINAMYIFFQNEFLIYLLPFAMIPIILTILGNKIYAMTFTFLNMIILSREETWFLVTIAVAIMAIYKADKMTSRSDIVKLGISTGIFQGITALSYGLVNQLDFPLLIGMIVLSVLSGILTGMISLALLPYFENSFEILTDIKLLELSDFSHALLKQLLVTAPGTFHHSIMVGALAESGAQAIGANEIFARVASYYHDIGKMKRPEFFVENQRDGKNMHNTIKPSLSALIITSHTKDGYIMGKQNKLPQEILDVILCHHGTTLVQFFYYKALENGEDVLENDFRYSGPKPRSKEAGIIMLADTIEAAVRVAEDKSREGIENLIRYLIKYKIDDNQLSESDLTLGEIEKIIQAFLNTLQGAYHNRIKYPKLDDGNRRG